MKPTIVIVPRMPARLTALLQARYTVLGSMARSTPEELPEGAEAAEVLLTAGGQKTDARLIDAMPNLKLISC